MQASYSYPHIPPSHTNASTSHSTAGLEKTLRFLQGLSQIILAYTLSPTAAAPWFQARKQFALGIPPPLLLQKSSLITCPGRRYLRFFKFIDAFAQASKAFNSSTGIAAILDVGKWSCLGIYLFLESCTITAAMEIHPPSTSTPTSWAPTLLLEANKFWLYALLFSLASSLLTLLSPSKPQRSTSISPTHPLAKKILTDACDLLIPGSITGWAPTSPAIVGAAMVVSTALGSEEIWRRVQRAGDAGGKGKGRVGGRTEEGQVRRKGRA
jgi:hypothetical protein